MKCNLVIRAVTIGGLLVLMAASAVAGTPIRLSFRDTTIASGAALSYPIYVDSSLSGYSVSSYQIQFTYNTTYFKFIGATHAGTIDSTWGAPLVKEVTPGTINIASAGSDTLAGTGKLVILNFTSNLFTGYYNQSGYFSFQTSASITLFNEGFPAISFRNGTVTLTPGPSIVVSPNTALLTKGDVVHFSASGGRLPYAWTSTSPSIASIDSLGNLTGLNAGFTKVVAVDSNGYVDTSGIVEVRAYRLSLRDTSCYQGQTINVPVYSTNLTGLGIVSGQFQVTYNQNLWTPTATVETGGILAPYGPSTFSANNGSLSISFAGSAPLTGSGVLVYVRMKASNVNNGGSTGGFQNAVFNENLVANVSTGNLTVQPLAVLSVTPSGSQTLVSGDSLQFSASGGVPPYTWSFSGSGQATISATGLFKSIGSGLDTVKVKDSLGGSGSSGAISIYDFRLNIPDTVLAPNSFAEVPLYVTSNIPGWQSYDLVLTYTTSSYVRADSLDLTGTLSNGMLAAQSFHGDTIALSLAGVNKIVSAGTLLKLGFAIPDSTPRPTTIYINVLTARFNEGVPLALPKNGSFQILNGPIFSVKPSSAALHALVGQKDSAVFTVYNTGSASLSSTISTLGSSAFAVSPTSIAVPAADSTKITVYFQPTIAGPAAGTIHFVTNDAYHNPVNISVSGVTPYPILAFSALSINFGTVSVGLHKDTTVTISNTGTDTLRITNISGSLPVFTAHPTSVTISPGHTFMDTLRFAPISTGASYGRFSVTSNSLTSPDTVGASGNGSAPKPILTFSTSVVSFGGVKVGSFKDTAVTISNVGTDTLKISSITTSIGVFSARPTIRIVPPGQSFSDTLRFAPTLTGGYSGRVFVASNAPSTPDTITVSGTGNPATDVYDLAVVPNAYSLGQNYPNPFNPSTVISYGLRSTSTVRLVVFNILGQKVDELVNSEQSEGIHAVTWNPSVPSGAYFYRIDATSVVNSTDHFTQIRKMILMK